MKLFFFEFQKEMDEQMLLRDALSRLLAEKQIECEAVKGEVLVLTQYKVSAKKKIGYLKRKIAVLEERLPPSLELSDSSDEAEDDVKIQKNIHLDVLYPLLSKDCI